MLMKEFLLTVIPSKKHSTTGIHIFYCLNAGSIGLQTTTFSLLEEEYTDSTVHAVVSVSCAEDNTLFSQCGSVATDIGTDTRCNIDSVVEVVCQGEVNGHVSLLSIPHTLLYTYKAVY